MLLKTTNIFNMYALLKVVNIKQTTYPTNHTFNKSCVPSIFFFLALPKSTIILSKYLPWI